MEKTRQEKRDNLPNNGFIGPSKQVIDGISHEMQDADKAIRTNAAILKKSVQQAKLQQFAEFKNDAIEELKDIPHDIVDSKKWNDLKKDTTDALESISEKTKHEISDTTRDFSKIGKKVFEKSSKTISQSREFLSENTPKMTKTLSASLKSIFKRRQSFSQKDLALLEKLSQLKDSGVITQKEFDSKKRKILAKI